MLQQPLKQCKTYGRAHTDAGRPDPWPPLYPVGNGLDRSVTPDRRTMSLEAVFSQRFVIPKWVMHFRRQLQFQNTLQNCCGQKMNGFDPVGQGERACSGSIMCAGRMCRFCMLKPDTSAMPTGNRRAAILGQHIMLLEIRAGFAGSFTHSCTPLII